jgi:7-carboxy-7-deazaguanine synthase
VQNSKKAPTLLIQEIYKSIQGESTFTGLPCIFVRLTGCDLRCSYCDSVYSFKGGETMTLDRVLEEVNRLQCDLVEITGGEPLLQKNVLPLMKMLCDTGKRVLLETSGAHDIAPVDPRVVRILDLKCPSSGESERNLASNLDHLTSNDEVKFVIGDRDDYLWARNEVVGHKLEKRVRCVLFSPVFPTAPAPGETSGHAGLESRQLVEWILEDRLPVRMQLQIHKYIWEPTKKGV